MPLLILPLRPRMLQQTWLKAQQMLPPILLLPQPTWHLMLQTSRLTL